MSSRIRFGFFTPAVVLVLGVLGLTFFQQPYNTRVVLMGTTVLGTCGGVVGVFMLLRKRSLVGDVVGHSSLPGIAIAFLVMESMQPGSGRGLSGLLVGATIAAILGIFCTLIIVHRTRIKEDAALAITLSIFYGFGISLLSIIQGLPTGSSAGLRDFIFGKAALMVRNDVLLIAWTSLGILVVCGLLFKEFALLCFDEGFGKALGWPTKWLDLLLMSVVVAVTVVGLQSVGLILVVAILIIPASAARFWSDHLVAVTGVAALIGGLGAYAGVLMSAMLPKIATGAVIVIAQSLFFLVSLLFGTRRGVVYRIWQLAEIRTRVGEHDLLRAMYELVERDHRDVTPAFLLGHAVPIDDLAAKRSWTQKAVRGLLHHAMDEELVWRNADGEFQLTQRGSQRARQAVRNHRLWELFLINYADIAPGQVDRNADRIEHVLDAAIIADLERMVEQERLPIPRSPHAMAMETAMPSS